MSDDDDYVDLANEVLENAPDEWDDDAAIGFIAVQYVRHLEAEVQRLGGRLYPHDPAHIDGTVSG